MDYYILNSTSRGEMMRANVWDDDYGESVHTGCDGKLDEKTA